MRHPIYRMSSCHGARKRMSGEGEIKAQQRVALVTGAARRIGLAISERLLQSGYRVALHCSPASLEEAEAVAARLVARIENAENCVCVIAGDLSDPATAARTIADAAAALGPLTLLVNNASVFAADAAESFELELWERHFAVNLRAPLLLAQAFAAQVTAGTEAAIVNIIDQRVWRPTPQFFTYSLSKSALWTATRSLAQAFAPRRIRVNAVGPGPVLPNNVQGAAEFDAEVAGVLLKQAVDLKDIADAVLYLAQARNVTGQMIAVDAGQHLAWETPDIVVTSQ
jgi:NAD(P)-dependent dehydrogenase (short-subunit alcohol dehydrogenase family)